MWADRRILDLFGIELPIIQAPMAGAMGTEMVIAVSEAGGLGSLPCAMLSAEQARAELGIIRQRTSRPINVNFFVHEPPRADEARESAWRERLRVYYDELGQSLEQIPKGAGRAPFDDELAEVVAEFRPEVVSFHFGLPAQRLVDRVKAAGAKVIASATGVREARWLADRGCDAIIAQGLEAGGHRGMFLSDEIARQVGTIALVPQVIDAVEVPVIAAGGIADARGIAAAFALGAAAVQIGTVFLHCPESRISAMHRDALKGASAEDTVLTNVFTGRPARAIVNRVVRELGPMSNAAPQFPLATAAVAPLRLAAEAQGSADFSPLWSGQGAALGRELPAGELTRRLAKETQERLARLGSGTHL